MPTPAGSRPIVAAGRRLAGGRSWRLLARAATRQMIRRRPVRSVRPDTSRSAGTALSDRLRLDQPGLRARPVFDSGAVIQALAAVEQGTLIIMTIDNGSSLAVLAAATADHDLVLRVTPRGDVTTLI
jgi:hypothetical protein